MKTHQAKVINVVQAKTRYGLKLVLNAELLRDQSKVACWSDDLGNKVFRSKHKGDLVELIESDKGKYSVLDREPPHNIGGEGLKPVKEIMPNIPKSNGYVSNGTATTTQYSQTYSQPNENSHFTSSNNEEVIEDLIHDVPMLSDLDKKKVAAFIDQQARLYRYTVDTVSKQFPELVGVDDRGIRSIALSLLINTNHMINRNL